MILDYCFDCAFLTFSFVEAARFPFQSKWLSAIGLLSPYEQWAFYGTLILSCSQSVRPMYKYYYMSKYLETSDKDLRLIWAFKGGLSQIELDAGRAMLEDYRRVPRRYAVIPLAFIAGEVLKVSYQKVSSYFRSKK